MPGPLAGGGQGEQTTHIPVTKQHLSRVTARSCSPSPRAASTNDPAGSCTSPSAVDLTSWAHLCLSELTAPRRWHGPTGAVAPGQVVRGRRAVVWWHQRWHGRWHGNSHTGDSLSSDSYGVELYKRNQKCHSKTETRTGAVARGRWHRGNWYRRRTGRQLPERTLVSFSPSGLSRRSYRQHSEQSWNSPPWGRLRATHSRDRRRCRIPPPCTALRRPRGLECRS